MSELSPDIRFYLFIFLCIPVRILLALIPQFFDYNIIFYLSFIYLAIASGFMYLYFTNSRLEAPEGGGKTWWAEFRIYHGIFYLVAGILGFSQELYKYATIPLMLDIIFGLIGYYFKRINN